MHDQLVTKRVDLDGLAMIALPQGPSAVRDASRVDSSWECLQRASGMPASSSLGHWPSTASLNILPESLPPSAGMEIRKQLRTLSYISGQSSVEIQDLRYLHHLVNATQPKLTGETGFASGLSALAIMTALGADARHVSIDPFQPAFQLDGVRGAQKYARGRRAWDNSRARAARPAFQHLNETAAFGLAWLLKSRSCFDFFFLDDGHKFEDNIIEVALASKLLAIGGLLVLHDAWPIGRHRLALEAVQATVAFIQSNLRFLEFVPVRVPGFAVFIKRFPDNRQWDHFVTFEWSTPNKTVGPHRFWNRPARHANPACQGARNVKPFKWCKSKIKTAEQCRDPYMVARCNATCNGC